MRPANVPPARERRQNVLLFLPGITGPAVPKSKRRWPARPAGPARVISLADRRTRRSGQPPSEEATVAEGP
jgi:hypothetical protein